MDNNLLAHNTLKSTPPSANQTSYLAGEIANNLDFHGWYKSEFGYDLDDQEHLQSFRLVYNIIRIRFANNLNEQQKRQIIAYLGKLYTGHGNVAVAYAQIYSTTERNAGLNKMLSLNLDLDNSSEAVEFLNTKLRGLYDYLVDRFDRG